MICLVCQNCRSELYSASPDFVRSCPKCGQPYDLEGHLKRKEARTEISKRCTILSGGIKLDAKAVDISRKGLGIQFDRSLPFDVNDTMHVIIKDFEIDAPARVVWVRNSENASKAGLMFF